MSKTVLPRGWLKSKLFQAIQPRGEKISPVGCDNMQFIGMDHVEAQTTKIIGSISAGLMKSNASRFYAGDVLYGRLRPYLNKVAQPNFDGLASAEFIVFPDTNLIYGKFLKYRLNAADFVSFASHLNEGDRPRVSFEQIGDFDIFVPPSQEQHRIVAKIEELFSELDKGTENLKTACAQLKVYRQALLKHAFEGKLTAQWRAENQDKLESAEALLKRIQTERAQCYQQQLTEWEASDKQGRKPKAPKTLQPLTKEEIAELPELPKGWEWVRLNEISETITDGDHQAPPQTTDGIPFVTISDIKNQKIDFSNTRYVSKSYFDSLSSARKPVRNDILYTVTGSFGIPCRIDFERDFCFQRHVGLIRSCKGISDKFLFYLLSSRHVYGQAALVATGTAQKTVPLGGLRLFKIPLASHAEQQQIARELESRLSEADQLDQTITTSLQQAEALRQSILKKAFSGQLVPQDPFDEPALKLLERINKEKTVQGNNGKRGRVPSLSEV